MHGVAGSGKSALLRAFRAEAAERGATVVAVDGRAIEPTPRASPARSATGSRRAPRRCSSSTPPSACGCSTAGCARTSCPRCRRTRASCSRPATPPAPSGAPPSAAAAHRAARPARAGRRGRGAAPRRARRGHRRRGSTASRAGTRCRCSWPPAVRARPDAPEDAILPTVVQELAALYLDGLERRYSRGARRDVRAAPRDALAAGCARARRRAGGGVRAPGGAAVRRARARGPGGPRHGPRGGRGDAARERPGPPPRLPRGGLAADPARAARGRRGRALGVGRRHAGAGRGAARARGVLPVLRPALRGRARAGGGSRRDRGDRRPPRAGRSRRAAARLVGGRAGRVPGRARPARRAVAFTILCELGEVPQRLLAERPDLRALAAPPARPPGRGRPAVCLLARMALAHGTGAATSPCLAALLRDTERAYPRSGPAVRRIYLAADGDALRAQIAPLGYAPLPGCPRRRARRRGLPADRLRSRARVGRGLGLRRSPRATSRSEETRLDAPRANSCSTAAGSR